MVILILEGLPGSGKTSTIKYLSKKLHNPYVGELNDNNWRTLNPEGVNGRDIKYFLKNDIRKYSMALQLSKYNPLVFVDRGSLSTWAYYCCQGNRKKIKMAKENHELIRDKYQDNIIYIYIKINSKLSSIRKKKKKDNNDLWCFKKNLVKTEKFYNKRLLNKENVVEIFGNKPLKDIQKELEYLLKPLTN